MKKQNKKHNLLNGQKVGLALGLISGIYFGLLGLTATYLNWGSALVRTLGSVYIGYDVSLKGALIGVLWGFLDAFIIGYLFCWVYNKLN